MPRWASDRTRPQRAERGWRSRRPSVSPKTAQRGFRRQHQSQRRLRSSSWAMVTDYGAPPRSIRSQARPYLARPVRAFALVAVARGQTGRRRALRRGSTCSGVHPASCSGPRRVPAGLRGRKTRAATAPSWTSYTRVRLRFRGPWRLRTPVKSDRTRSGSRCTSGAGTCSPHSSPRESRRLCPAPYSTCPRRTTRRRNSRSSTGTSFGVCTRSTSRPGRDGLGHSALERSAFRRFSGQTGQARRLELHSPR